VAQLEVRIPDIGDAEDVEVVEILVAPGAQVALDDPLIVIESDKASMEVPATAAGRLKAFTVAVGDKVREGQVIAVIESPHGTTATESAAAIPRAREPAPVEVGRPTTSKRVAAEPSLRRIEVRVPDIGDAKDVVVVEVNVKVGQSVQADDLLMVVESDKASMEIPAPVTGQIVSVDVSPGVGVSEGTLLVVIETGAQILAQPVVENVLPAAAVIQRAVKSEAARPSEVAPIPISKSESGEPARDGIYAGPGVRRLARELGVDLAKVDGSGVGGRILRNDVQAFVRATLAAPQVASIASAATIPAMPEVDFAKFGPIEIVPLSRIRARGAENLHRSWLNVPHVTQHDDADITDLEAFRGELKEEVRTNGIKLTPLPFIVKAVIATLRAFPALNASLDRSVQSLIVKRYINIGFAVDTPDGLVVPVVRDAGDKGVLELAREIERLSAKAQSGKLSINELQGASFTISSLGAIGGLGFSPIVNAPEVAILGVSRLTVKPHWNGTAFEPRQMLPLSLSYDHRAINGAEAGRFLTTLCQTLHDTRRMLL
jgi:pyruvate dehydrogenase E2 component (dihydrolipoamide acetyltransferase)